MPETIKKKKSGQLQQINCKKIISKYKYDEENEQDKGDIDKNRFASLYMATTGQSVYPYKNRK